MAVTERIEVRYSHTALGPHVPFKHKYIVYTDSDGNQYAARGGPGYWGPGALEGIEDPSNSVFGNIVNSHDVYDENFPDWDAEGDDPAETILEGSDLSGYWQAIKDAMDAIENEMYPYSPRQNSNTAVDEALRRSGLPEPELDDFGENLSPGSGLPLVYDGYGVPRDDEIPGGWSEPFESAESVYPPISPLVLDLDGDGTESVSVTAGAYFDHNADGFSEATGWAGPDDGLLVWDRNADGRIESGRELFGTETLLQNGQLAANGFVALAEWDTNTDGRIDASDAIWSSLKVWVDRNGDGYSAAGELLSLTDAGVASINLSYANGSGADAAGNEEWLTGSFTRTDASTGEVTDYRFVRDPKLTIAREWLEVPSVIADLPAIASFGTVYDLHQAMVRDSSGALQTLVEGFAAETATAARNALLEQILLKWTGAESVDPASRGSHIDARHLVALEAFMGRSFVDVYGLPDPNQNAAALLNSAYDNLSKSIYVQLMAQTHLEYLYDQIVYTWDNGLVGDLSALEAHFESNISSGDGTELLDAVEFIRTVKDFGIADTLGLSTLQSIPGLAGLINGSFAILSGGVGGDTLTGGVQADVAVGLGGDDSISTADGNDVVHGGDGNDTIQSGNGNDLVYAGAGDDTVTDTAGWDTIYGGDGNDTITGASQFYGQYTIYGGAGDDVISVHGGGWPIQQETYTQTLSGGTGNDTITGSLGYNIYLYSRGDGADTINDYSQYAREDKIVLGAGIALGDVSARRVGQALELRIADPGNPGANDRITINSWFSGANYQVERVEFADASVLTAAQLSVMGAHVYGTEGNDTLTGFAWSSETLHGLGGNDTISDPSGNDTVYAGAGDDTITVSSQQWGSNWVYGEAGNDTITVGGASWYQSGQQIDQTQHLWGGLGNDTFYGGIGYNVYHFDRGDGADTINDYSQYARDDKIVLGAGIALGDVSARRVGQALELRISDPGNPGANDRITINNWFSGTNYQVERVEFADASVLTAAQLTVIGAHVYGTEGNDTLTGFASSSETLHGLGGNDAISDPSGNDTVYAGAGDDTITVSSQHWGSNWVYGEAGNDTITVGGASWYQPGQQIDQTQHLWGGPGNDTIYGGIGYNVYHYDRGDGADTINDYSPYVRDDKIVFGLGIALGDVSARRVGQALELRIANPGNPGANDRITINNWFSGANYQVERVEFADASVLTAAQLTSMAAIVTGTQGNDSITGFDGNETYYGLGGNDTIYSGNGNDIVYGGPGDDTINDIAGWDTIYGEDGNDTIIVSSYYWGSTTVFGGAGNDVITVPVTQWPYNQAPMTHNFTGGLGNDTFNGGIGNTIYHYARGDGADTITDDSYGYAGTDRIVFKVGIGVGDVSAQRIGNDLQLRVADPGNPTADDRITIKNWYDPYVAYRYKIERLEFADGSVVLESDIRVGDGGANTLSASANASIISGGGGNDILNGGAGGDSIHGGTGNDTITAGGGSDAVHGDDGDDNVSGGDGNDVLYGDAGADTLSGGSGDDYVAGGSESDTVNGDDGADALQGGAGDDQVSGGSGNDLVSGDGGNDVLDGGDGNDLLAGGSGNDTINTGSGSNIIAYNAGGGIDTVYAAVGASNTLSFGGGIGYEDLSLSRDANDLIVSAGTGDHVVLKDWYAGSNNVLSLQIIHDASDEFDANSSDPLYNKRVQTFDFAGLVAEFDDALAQSPGLTSWAVTNALLEFHLLGSDDAAIGGDLAYWYGKNAGFTGISLQASQQVLGGAGFGSDAQTLQAFSGLQEGYVKLT